MKLLADLREKPVALLEDHSEGFGFEAYVGAVEIDSRSLEYFMRWARMARDEMYREMTEWLGWADPVAVEYESDLGPVCK